MVHSPSSYLPGTAFAGDQRARRRWQVVRLSIIDLLVPEEALAHQSPRTRVLPPDPRSSGLSAPMAHDEASLTMEERIHRWEVSDKQDSLLEQSKGIQCSICMEEVVALPAKSERRFGILPACEHPFCLGCIRECS